MRANKCAIAIAAAGSWMLSCTGDSSNLFPGDGGDAAPRDAKAVDAALDGPRADGGGDAGADGGHDAASDVNSGNPIDAAIIDSGKDVGVVDTGVVDAGATDAGPSSAGIRVANWSSDAPAVDFCLATAGSNVFQGPMMKARAPQDAGATTPDGGVLGLTFPKVSSYSLVSPGKYDLRVVVALAADCSVSVVGDAMTLQVSAGAPVTVGLVGTGPLRTLVAFADEVTPKPANVALRFIHAASGIGPVSFGTGSVTGTFKALFSGVAFPQASLPATAPTLPDGGAGPAPDSSGYLQRSPLTMTALSAQLIGVTDDSGAAIQLASTTSFSAVAGAVVTFVLLGPSATPQLMRCFDNAGIAPSASNPFGLYSDCVIAAP
jgi:hypothetical protein